MDFKKLINHIESIDGPIETPQAPKAAEPIRLDEDTELRVLAGVTPLTESMIAERRKNAYAIGMATAKKQAGMGDEPATDLPKKVITKGHEIAKSIKKNEALDMKLIGAAQKGASRSPLFPDQDAESNAALAKDRKLKKAGKEAKGYGYRGDSGAGDNREADAIARRKASAQGTTTTNDSFDPDLFQEKFSKMVEAKKTVKGKKAEEKMDEAKGSKPDFLDIDKDGDKKEPMKTAAKQAGKKPAAKGKTPADKTGMTAAQKKLPPGLQKAIAAKKGKKTVKESVETKLSFREMIKLVIESGGQQQIDPLDKELFAWATRVSQSKFAESTKAEVYAGLVYERMGGRFDMYDVLSEDK
jgi:hypothetical protein